MKLLRSTFEENFVKHTMMIALPIMLQNGITNFVNMLDNIMVGRIGTDPMTGVSVVNSLLFVWNLCLFGGLSVVSSLNISQTLANVFNVAFIAMGSATAIIIGQKLGELGESDPDEVREEAWRLTIFSVFLCVISGILMISASAFFPQIYNTSDEIRALATWLICIAACFMPFHAFNNASYFIIRSGGKTWITFLFDSCFCWIASIPAAYFLAHYTQVPIVPMYAIVTSIEMIKVAIGWKLINNGFWIRDITV